jgi:hypothetical protein
MFYKCIPSVPLGSFHSLAFVPYILTFRFLKSLCVPHFGVLIHAFPLLWKNPFLLHSIKAYSFFHSDCTFLGMPYMILSPKV